MALTSSDIARIRADRGSSALLFLTDRCPVECAHCSVGSLRSGPGISDWPRFTSLVAGLAAHRRILVVAISGGDPFAERRGLSHAVRELSAAGKQLVLHTSGFFGAAQWAEPVLRRTETVVLSTDRHHRARVPDQVWLAAARLIRACGAWLVVQSIEEDADQAAELLHRAFGRGWADWAEIVRQPGLAHGRGADWYQPARASSGERCALVGTPVVRYDGTVTACCNETVIMGAGRTGCAARRPRPRSCTPPWTASTTIRCCGPSAPPGPPPCGPGQDRTASARSAGGCSSTAPAPPPSRRRSAA